jgi:hypothetical protein
MFYKYNPEIFKPSFPPQSKTLPHLLEDCEGKFRIAHLS